MRDSADGFVVRAYRDSTLSLSSWIRDFTRRCTYRIVSQSSILEEQITDESLLVGDNVFRVYVEDVVDRQYESRADSTFFIEEAL